MSEGQTVGQAVEQIHASTRMLDEARWADVLPAHIGPKKFQRWALTLMQDPKMVEVSRTPAGQLSIVTALLDCASLGLEPGRTYHLVPFGGKVTGITDYKGEIELIYNAVQRPVVASLVYSKDEFYMTGANIPPKHDADWFAEEGRGHVVGGYAFVEFGHGPSSPAWSTPRTTSNGACSQVVRMTEAEFLKHRAKAKTKDVWDEWPEAMRIKTLVHQLRKFVPWSVEKSWSAEVRQP